MKSVLRTILLSMLLLLPLGASAQSCALCYTQAAGSGSKVIQALKSGILVLIFPPLFICTGLIVVGYRKRNSCMESPGEPSGDDLGW